MMTDDEDSGGSSGGDGGGDGGGGGDEDGDGGGGGSDDDEDSGGGDGGGGDEDSDGGGDVAEVTPLITLLQQIFATSIRVFHELEKIAKRNASPQCNNLYFFCVESTSRKTIPN